MRVKLQEKGENIVKVKIPTSEIIYFILCLLSLFHQLASVPVQYEFFGADETRIRETPKYLKICHKSDKNIDKCIKSSLEKFMENVNSDSGSEEMNLPTIDPIEVPLLDFQQGSGNVSLHLTFKDFRIYGFKHLSITSVKSNLNDSKFEISIQCPVVKMEAQFSAEGRVFTFPISGQGDFFFNMTDVSAVLILHLTTQDTLPGLRFFVVEDAIMDLLPSDINAHFGDFIDGSNKIGAAFNTFFNKNAQEIFTMVKPNLSEIFAKIFASFANQILSRHPEDVLLPD